MGGKTTELVTFVGTKITDTKNLTTGVADLILDSLSSTNFSISSTELPLYFSLTLSNLFSKSATPVVKFFVSVILLVLIKIMIVQYLQVEKKGLNY